MLLPKLSVYLNWFYTADGKYDFIVFMLVPHIHTANPSTNLCTKERKKLQICEYTERSIYYSVN